MPATTVFLVLWVVWVGASWDGSRCLTPIRCHGADVERMWCKNDLNLTDPALPFVQNNKNKYLHAKFAIAHMYTTS